MKCISYKVFDITVFSLQRCFLRGFYAYSIQCLMMFLLDTTPKAPPLEIPGPKARYFWLPLSKFSVNMARLKD